MQLPYSDQLNIAALSRLFDNKSECYKLFWFQAIRTFEERFEKALTEIRHEEKGQ